MIVDWQRVHEKRDFSPAVLPLALFSLFYGMGVMLRLSRWRRKRPGTLDGFVLSVGNITAGGTGKTPAVCMLADWAAKQGYRTAVLSRGYGGSYGTGPVEVSDGSRLLTGPAECGDEPYLLAGRLRGIPVIVSRDRHRAGLYARGRFRSNFYILDDGFQHLALRRDLDLVLLDATSPLGNGRLLPWGPLREPAAQLKRADLFLLTRAGDEFPPSEPADLPWKRFPEKELFRSRHVPEKVILPLRGEDHDPGFLEGRRVAAFAGIARPGDFRSTLINLGAEVVAFEAFKDHHAYRPGDVGRLVKMRKAADADLLLTTEKDWVRLESHPGRDAGMGYVTVGLEIISGRQRFFDLIKAAADARLSRGGQGDL